MTPGLEKRMRWGLEVALLRGFQLLVRVLPEPAWRALGRGLGRLAGDGFGYRRQVVDDNLRAAFPLLDAAERRAIAASMFRRLGESLCEFFALGRWSRDEILAHVPELDIAELEALRDQGRGAILMTGHFGNWELLGAAAAARGLPIHVVARTQSNPWADALQNRIRERAGMRVIKAESSLREILRTVRGGGFVAMLPDVNTPGDGVFVDFLGRKAATPRGVAVFAWRLGCPVFSRFLLARGDGTHAGLPMPTLHPDGNKDEAPAVYELTRAMAANLEACVRAHPDHYLWVHRRWKTRPPEESAKETEP
ncbi:MAG TPA: lysophospholipid acyltransferase family protein [Candidatus Krumholzibacteria bacterium]|nr:lysophospholipid acyltransferase family protein [Candidatus Krumholzibacteria bacterium]